jgi:hypothetical protein
LRPFLVNIAVDTLVLLAASNLRLQRETAQFSATGRHLASFHNLVNGPLHL